MTALYHLEHRFTVDLATVERVRAACSASGSFSWVGDRRLRIHTWRGVPGKHCDVLLADEPYRAGSPFPLIHSVTGQNLRPDSAWLLVCDVGRKQGHYDGATRWRITFRDLQPMTRPECDPPRGKVFIDEDEDGLHFVAHWKTGMWGQCFPQLRYLVDERTDLVAILIRQAQLFYPFLWRSEEEQVRALAAEWACMPATKARTDINDLNRDASQCIYEMARYLGWRKLTRREKERLGLDPDGPQWQRADKVLRLRHGNNGIGDHTLAAAAGETIHMPRGVCPQCQELSAECDCVV